MGKAILNLKNFMELVRFYSLNMTFASCLIIFAYAHFYDNFSIFNFLLILIAMSCMQMGANLFDCYIDVKSQLKQGLTFENMVFSTERKARLIRNKTFSLKQVEFILITLFTIAILIGIYFAIKTSPYVLLFGLLGGILTLLYPVSSKFNMAEIIVGLIFGPLMIMGGFFALTNTIDTNLFLLSWSIFFTTIILLHTHNIMDWEFDEKEGKNTFARMTGNKNNAINALKWMIILSYAIIVFGVLALSFNPKMLYVFLTLPIATKLIESMKDYINIKDVEFKPRWYWGMFENWQQIKELKLDYFMFRFYLARNFSFFFALFASLGVIIS